MLDKLFSQNQQLLQSYLLESSSIGIVLLDAEKRIIDCNHGFTRFFMLEKKPVGDLLSLHLDIKGKQQCVTGVVQLVYYISKVIQGVLECHIIPVEAGCLIICERLVLTESKAMETLGRMNNELTDMQRDLVKKGMILNRLNKELAEARNAADTANHAKSDFLSTMSHEIRTPMSGVIGMVQLLRFTQLDEEQQEYLEAIETASGNLLSLINNILDLSKIESGKIELEFEDFSLQSCVDDVTAMQRSRAMEKRLNINIRIQPDLPLLVSGDQLRVKQILLNLLSNAIKFTVQGHITVEAMLLEKKNDHALVQLIVSDSGIGMSPAALEKIFKPFTQADASTSRRFGGTGLGLAICRQLADLMGGRIWAESEEGKGARFHLELPFSIPVQPEETVAESRLPEQIAASATSQTILVVDDDQLNLRTTALILQKMGYLTKSADNGSRAVEIWQQGGIDFVLTDIQMPVMSGIEAMKNMRDKEAATGNHTMIIAMTADVLKWKEESLLSEGFDSYLPKPFKIADLKIALQQAAELQNHCF